MGIAKIVTLEELKEGNKRMCLSPLRVFNRCFECPQYEKCESRIINEEYLEKKEKLDKLKTEIKKIEGEIKILGDCHGNKRI